MTGTIKPKNRVTAKNGASDLNVIVKLPKLRIQTLKLKLIGDMPLIIHAWSEKAIKMMLAKQCKEAEAGREAKNPVEDFKGSLYYLPDGSGFGIPTVMLKACMVTAAPDVDLAMTEMRRAFHIDGELIRLIAEPVKAPITEWDSKYREEIKFEHDHGASMRMDMVRLESGVADIRFRGQFVNWSIEPEIKYNESVVSYEQLVNLANVAGFGVGLGEMRPFSKKAKAGQYGRFHVE